MKTMLVTGSAGGIGGAVVDRLLSLGHRVVGLDSVPSRQGRGAFSEHLVDISDWEQLDRFFEDLRRDEPAGIDALIHCAGIGQSQRMAHITRAGWEQILRVNLGSVIAILQNACPLIKDSGRVLLFGSGIGIRGDARMFAYSAAKGGVMSLAKSLANDLGERNITINVISPGFTRTGMTAELHDLEETFMSARAIRRPAIPEDLVGITEFLLSDGAAFITGQTLSVDGGSVKL